MLIFYSPQQDNAVIGRMGPVWGCRVAETRRM
jgi:hypothetical protein